MRRASFPAVASGFLVLAAACNGILGNESSITYVEDDAQSPAPDGGGSAGEDAAVADAIVNGDATEGFFDAAVEPCDAATFCAEFDPPTDVPPYGFGMMYPGNGALFPVEDASVTPPNSLLSTAQTSEPAGRYLRHRLVGARPMRFSFALFVRESADVDFFVVRCTGTTGPSQIEVGWRNPGERPTFRIDGQDVTNAFPLPLGTWHRVSLAIEAAATTLTIAPVTGGKANNYQFPKSCAGPYDVDLGVARVRVIDGAGVAMLFDQVRGNVQ